MKFLAFGAILFGGVMLSACATEYKTPDGPPEFKQGYANGCASGNVAGGNGLATFTKDAKRYDADPLYKQGWDNGFATCKGQFEAMDRNWPAYTN